MSRAGGCGSADPRTDEQAALAALYGATGREAGDRLQAVATTTGTGDRTARDRRVN